VAAEEDEKDFYNIWTQNQRQARLGDNCGKRWLGHARVEIRNADVFQEKKKQNKRQGNAQGDKTVKLVAGKTSIKTAESKCGGTSRTSSGTVQKHKKNPKNEKGTRRVRGSKRD